MRTAISVLIVLLTLAALAPAAPGAVVVRSAAVVFTSPTGPAT
jgi:hypothetical protein